jgi:hypothetical protein
MTTNAVKFHKFYVTNGSVKARVFYSHGQIYNSVKDGVAGGLRECVTLYAKDFDSGRALAQILSAGYQNDTDLMSDYFDEGRTRLFPGDALYAAALARCAT